MTLHAKLLEAHAKGDGVRLAALYTDAADAAETVDEECFFLTHAYVYALENGLPDAAILNMRLVQHGRAHPLKFKKETAHAD